MCPLDKMNMSFESPLLSTFKTLLYNVTKNSTQPSEPPGCPELTV